MLYRSVLRGYVIAALTAAQTQAGANVFSPRDWPTNSDSYPAILVQAYRERKDARGHVQVPQFIAVARVSVVARIKGTDGAAVEESLEEFCEQIENAVLTNQAVLQAINQIAYVETDMGVTANGRDHIGELQIDFGLEYPVDFDPYLDAPEVLPPIAVPLESAGLYVDTTVPFDPNGTYADPPIPSAVIPAPRTQGPDGRVEIGAEITLPQ